MTKFLRHELAAVYVAVYVAVFYFLFSVFLCFFSV
ncbi:unnamed protein product [Brassica oleracea var. botrytis]